jgi:hypothetical protein
VQANHLQIPLSGGAGARVLRLRWSYPAGAEPLHKPNLASPRIQHVPPVAVLGKVIVPVGRTVEPNSQAAFLRGVDVDSALQRAKAMRRLSALLAEHNPPSQPLDKNEDLLQAQRAFFEQVRRAEHLSLRRSSSEPEQAVGAVAELQRDNGRLAQKLGYETVRARAEKHAAQGKADSRSLSPGAGITLPQVLWPLTDEGLLLTWKTDGSTQPGTLFLSTAFAQHTRLATRGTELLLIALVFVWILSNLSPTLTLLRQCWPEQLFFLAALGHYAFGLSLIGLVLAAVAVLARMVLLVVWLQRLLQRSTPETPSAPSTYNPAT